MELNEIKTKVSEMTGIPVDVLNGNNAEEIIEQAKNLIDYKKSFADPNRELEGKSTREQFAIQFEKAFGSSHIDNLEGMSEREQFAAQLERALGITHVDDAKSSMNENGVDSDIP